MRYCCQIREQPHYRRDAFEAGLRAAGLKPAAGPSDCDLLIIWNRYGGWDTQASKVEKRGGVVVVAENGYLGNELAGDRWYAISRSQHNGAGQWPDGGPWRWDSLGVELEPWREGKEIVVLPQRGIGPMGVAMPDRWERDAVERLAKMTRRPVRVRAHPGVNQCVPLEEDLRNAHCVVTWGSGAAWKALRMGVPVFYDFDRWIGAPGAMPLRGADIECPLRCDVARLRAFRRMAWAQWKLSEIQSGEAFRALLE